MAGDAADRTESASARRLEKAREQGDVPVSRDAVTLAGLAAGSLALAAQMAAAGAAPSAWFAAMLEAHGTGDDALAAGAGLLFHAVLPGAAAAAGGVAGATLLQTGFLFRLGALQPDPGRISPLAGIKRIVSVETLVQAGKSLIKLVVLSASLWWVLHRLLPDLELSAHWPPSMLAHRLIGESTRLLMALAGAQALIALADIVWVRRHHAAKLRMSRQELRDEHKEAEGNPHVKQRLRQIGRLRARRRMMAAVRKAAVVVTNPTHYAVALAYERGSKAAPRVVAKGMDELADRIREEAREHHIPMVANPPLARALYRVELDMEIPVEHFRAVAEIVAYIWRLRQPPPL